MKMKWIPEYNTGIDVIDDQHRRILDYINEIDEIGIAPLRPTKVLFLFG
jgi:hemerythrin